MEASVGQDSHVGLHLIPHLEGLDQRREIGRGSFGAVYEVKMNGLPCIAKGLHDILLGRGGNLPIREAEKEAIRAKFHYECALLGNLKHPNIVQFLGVHQLKDNEWLVMEYLHMDLAKCLEMYPDIPLPLKLSILRDVSYGLLHLHSQAPPIIHRDLTAPNILLTRGMSAKIADLGVSKIFDTRQLQRSTHTLAPGTWAYMPPETLSPDPKYDAKLDVFSYGVLTLYVANQEFPNVHEPPIPPLVTKKQEIQIYKRKHWVDKMGVSHPLHSVVMSCLMDHPDHRPTSKELNDIITKLCTQKDNSCKNVLELIKENEELKAQRRKLERENVAKTQQAIPVQKDDEAARRRFEQQLQTKDDEILSLLVAIKDRDHEVKLAGVKANLEAMEQLIQLQTKRLTAELEAAKEEIAVKVAQVKQYQKQVEAYKQQPRILEEAMQPFCRGQSFTEPVCVQSKMNQSELNSGSDTSKSGPVASFPECCEPDGVSDEDDDSDDDLPPPIYHVPIEYQHSTNGVQGSTPFSQLGLPLGSDGVAHTNGNPPMPSPHLMQNTATADGIDGGTSCIGAGSRRDTIGRRDTYSPAPLDPNLKCPVCGICFKKGRIQKFKQHVQTCKVHA